MITTLSIILTAALLGQVICNTIIVREYLRIMKSYADEGKTTVTMEEVGERASNWVILILPIKYICIFTTWISLFYLVAKLAIIYL